MPSLVFYPNELINPLEIEITGKIIILFIRYPKSGACPIFRKLWNISQIIS